MEFKTESGVSITLIEGESSAILAFDRSVRAVELSKSELLKIKAFLTPGAKTDTVEDGSKLLKPRANGTGSLEGI